MKKLIRPMVLSISMCACATTSYAWPPPLMKGECDALCPQVRDGAMILSLPTITGDELSACTVQAFERDDVAEFYYFATAAHCVAIDNTLKEKVRVLYKKVRLHADHSGTQTYIVATVAAAGYRTEGDDFAVLRVAFSDMKGFRPPVIPFAPVRAETGETFVSFAMPGGAGLQFLPGWVSRSSIDVPLVVPERDINWEGGLFIHVPVAGGSSGSAIVSVERKAIIGILVGHVPFADSAVALPSDRFLKFWERVKNGTYPWFKMEEENAAKP